jgi:peptidoglycan lytic transglycosylase D
MKETVCWRAFSIYILLAIPSFSYALTPPNPVELKPPPVPELIITTPEKSTPQTIDDPSISQSDQSEITAPALPDDPSDDEEALDDPEPVASDLPPIVKPSHEEIKEKVISELKELEKSRVSKTKASFDFPIVINDQVEYFIDYFQTKLRKRFSLWMARSTRYMAMMKKILSAHGLPEDLIYLAMIESGFSPKAHSRAQAVGLWQFIQGTGERYGLRVNSWLDERKDPIKSTEAAARHLSDLYNRFGSWYLAAAGYNAGEGKISRALALYNAQNFWEITAEHCRYIKEETKQYVPKMIAAALIAREPEKYGFADIPYQPPFKFDEATLPGGVELKDVAAACGVSVDTLVEYNPELKRWITPPNTSNYILRIPVGTKERLLENYAQLIKPKPVMIYAEHRVKRGERLASIARRYGVKASLIARVNRIKRKGRLNTGLVLLIPQRKWGSSGSPSEMNSTHQENQAEKNYSLQTARVHLKKGSHRAADENEKEANLHRFRYKVRRGDSLLSIAEKFDLEVSMIKKWNRQKGKKILAGGTLILYVSKSEGDREGKKNNGKPGRVVQRKLKAQKENRIKLVRYTVKKGDCLSEIAQKFNTTSDKIRNWNRLSSRNPIKPGDKLSLKLNRPPVENI